MKSFPDGFELRAMLYARAPMAGLRALDRPGIAVCDTVSEPERLPERVRWIQPHVLVLWDAPPDLDGLTRDPLPHPPQIIARFAAPWADAVAEEPSAAALGAIGRPCAQLAFSSLPERQACAEGLLDELGMSPALLGRACIARGAALLSAWPAPLPPLQYHLYPLLAKETGAAPATVEKRIRSAIESAWLHGDWAAQNRLLGLSVSAERGKPTNSELLCRLADRIAETLYTS